MVPAAGEPPAPGKEEDKEMGENPTAQRLLTQRASPSKAREMGLLVPFEGVDQHAALGGILIQLLWPSPVRAPNTS